MGITRLGSELFKSLLAPFLFCSPSPLPSSSSSFVQEESVSAEFKQHKKKKRSSEQNINVRAAFIHAIADLIQSIGVVIAGYIIWFKVG